jgi:hypothetical protein
MTTKQQFLRELISKIGSELEASSFKKKKRSFVREVGGEALGVVGLNVTTHRADGYIGVIPIVGVRYEPIEAKVEEWSGEERPNVVGTTISIPLGYVTPEKTFMEWLFGSGVDTIAEIGRMIRMLQDYGLPFMMAHGNLVAITEALKESNFTNNESRRYRLPVAQLLQGKSHIAVQMVNDEASRLESRTDEAAQSYRKFATRFLKEAGKNGSGPIW